MSKEKQIEEMWNIITTDCNEECVGCEFENDNWCFTHRVINNLYNAGYRKQSEVEWRNLSKVGVYMCTACTQLSPRPYPYCPKCGAKMKGENNE